MKYALPIWLLLLTCFLYAQSAPPQGLRQKAVNVVALTNATIIVSPEKTLEKATLVIRDQRIEAVGVHVSPPRDARVIDLKQKFIYPGFIEAYSGYGIPAPPKVKRPPGPHPTIKNVGTRHWNAAVRPEKCAAQDFEPDSAAAKILRSQGFTVVQSAHLDGIFRGQSSVMTLGEDLPNHLVLKKQHAQFLAFTKGSSLQDYPRSLMGSIALVRQTLYDARWYRDAQRAYRLNSRQKRPEKNEALAALETLIRQRVDGIFETGDELSLLRAAQIADEFDLKFIYKGSGLEYRRLEAVRALNAVLIIPLNFPKVPDVSTPEAAMDVTLAALKQWDSAPENPARLEKSGVQFALTSHGLKDPAAFLKALRTAVQRGLSQKTALAALTTVPAQICGVSQLTGTLEKGRLANVIVADQNIFADEAVIYSVWIEGKPFEVNPMPQVDPRGCWELTFQSGDAAAQPFELEIKGSLKAPAGNISRRQKQSPLTKLLLQDNKLQFSFSGDSLDIPGIIRLSGRVAGKTFNGTGHFPGGAIAACRGKRISGFQSSEDASGSTPPRRALFETVYPDKAFGRSALPSRPSLVAVKKAAIWTLGDRGTLKNADIIIKNGKIHKIGVELPIPAGALVIDGRGKHLTPGIVDEHSHIAISSGVNEGSQAVTAEVRIGDVVNSDDINIYRQLAGGVTTSQLLHGSANPIGGQAQVIKLRWGALPEAMKFKSADPTIKFALGENVKQSNWGDLYRTRYPQSRMGVEAIMRDEFQSAREYQQAWKRYRRLSASRQKRTVPPRRDLELDAIVEVLNSERFIHCHSYVQSEILMLIQLAEEFGFRIGTFTHILEGYKVAEEIARHGADASAFADWWAYKLEVYDAIPYNAPLMHRRGVLTSYNSDDAEMGRRLNLEAAKAIKYGEISEEDALKFIMLNPARQLHVDQRVGSLEKGKDADWVLWSGHPLSVYSKVLQTWIDGRKYFDIQEDLKARQDVKKQRAALIQKALAVQPADTSGDISPQKLPENLYHCDDIHDYMRDIK